MHITTILVQLFLFTVTCFSLKEAAVIVQAPKYVPEQELLNLVQKYYGVLESHQSLSPNEGIEIDLPVPENMQQQYPPMDSTVSQQDKNVQYANENDVLKKAEDAVLNIQESEITKVQIQSTSSPPDLKTRTIYQDDVQKALDELKERLKAGGNRPATIEDLKTLVDELEKRILNRQMVIEEETTTPPPCDAERIMQEALKPVLEEDLKDMINLNLSHSVEVPTNKGEETPRPIEVIIFQGAPKAGPTIRQEIIDLLEDDAKIEKSWVIEDAPYVPIVRIPTLNRYN